MNPHDRAAFTGALRSALQDLDSEARAQFVEWAQSIGIKTAEPKLGGTLSVAKPKPRIGLKADEFEAWMREHQPQNIETVEKVRPAAETALRTSLQIIDGEVWRVVDRETGEMEPFPAAHVIPAGEPYAAWKGGDEAKAEVLAWLRERLDAVAELMAADRPEVES